jgi:hypothetical protein
LKTCQLKTLDLLDLSTNKVLVMKNTPSLREL